MGGQVGTGTLISGTLAIQVGYHGFVKMTYHFRIGQKVADIVEIFSLP